MAATTDNSSSAFTMPDVFVVPPAEDKLPGWRCFNAANLEVVEERSLEVEEQDVAGLLENVEAAKAPSTASQSQGKQSVVDAPTSHEHDLDRATVDTDSDANYDPEFDEETQEDEDQHRNGQHHALTRFRRQESLSDTGNDSDVIEVVKVSRSHRGSEGNGAQQPPPPQGLKRSMTFKAKASKALRTLGIAFRSSKTKTRVDEVSVASRPSSRISYLEEEKQQQQPTAEVEPTRAQSPPPTPIEQTAPRTPAARMSRRLSQIFTVSTIGRSRSSTIVPNSTNPEDVPLPPSPSQPTFGRRPSVSSRPIIPSEFKGTQPSRQTPEAPVTTIRPTNVSQPDEHRPSTLGTKSRSTFSRVNLKTLFSFSPNEQGQLNERATSELPSTLKRSMDSDRRTTPTLKRKSSSLPSTSSDSSAGPQTPTTTADNSPSAIQVGPITDSISNMAHELEGLGEADLGILPSEGSLPSKISAPRQSISSSDSGGDENQPPLYRRYSSSSYRSSMETTATTTLAAKPPTLPPIHHLDYMESEDLVDVNDAPAATKEEVGDTSLEMRLDSLHFDSLSFDADQFVLDLEEIKVGR